MKLTKRLTFNDLRAHRRSMLELVGVCPEFWTLSACMLLGHEVWEYEDMRGPLDGDGGFAVVGKQTGNVIHRHAIWFS